MEELTLQDVTATEEFLHYYQTTADVVRI
uniref:Uncharacterized protein n=1 Tax=Arundo donax TaxID=35708 RepID=A0A0A8ZFT6_ARUDO